MAAIWSSFVGVLKPTFWVPTAERGPAGEIMVPQVALVKEAQEHANKKNTKALPEQE